MKYIVLSILFLPFIAFGAVTHDYTTNVTLSSNGTSVTQAHDATGASLLLVEFIILEETTNPSNVTVTFNGDSLTNLNLTVNYVSAYHNFAFYMVDPDQGNYNVVISWTNNGRLAGHINGYGGADTIVKDTENSYSMGTTWTDDIVVASGQMAHAFVYALDGTPSISCTAPANESGGDNSTYNFGIASCRETGSGTVTIDGTRTNSWGNVTTFLLSETIVPEVTFATSTLGEGTGDIPFILGIFLVIAFYFIIRSIYGSMFKLK